MAESLQAIVLVVEDHEDTRDFYVAVLEAEGYRAVAVADGATALRQAEVLRFDASSERISAHPFVVRSQL